MVQLLPLIKSQFWTAFPVPSGYLHISPRLCQEDKFKFEKPKRTETLVEANAVLAIGLGVCAFIVVSARGARMDKIALLENGQYERQVINPSDS